jgi:WD40 repeat protein
MKKFILLFLALLLFGCSAGVSQPVPTDTGSVLPTPTASPTPLPTVTSAPTNTPTPIPANAPISGPPYLAGTPIPSGRSLIQTGNVGQMVQLAQWGKGTVNQVAYSPDGKLFAVASSIGIYLYNPGTLSQIRLIETMDPVTHIAFSPDGNMLLAGSPNGLLELWDTNTGRKVHTLNGLKEIVNSVAFSPDGRLVAAGTGDPSTNASIPEVKIWDVSTGQVSIDLKGIESTITSLAFSPDGKVLATGYYYHDTDAVILWDPVTGAKLRTLEEIQSGWEYMIGINCLSFSPDGKILAAGSYDSVVLWNTGNWSQAGWFENEQFSHVTSLAFSPDSHKLVTATNGDTIQIFDLSRPGYPGITVVKNDPLVNFPTEVNSLAMSMDGKTLVSTATDGSVDFWDASSGTKLRSLAGYMTGVGNAVFSPDGKGLASVSDHQPIMLWDSATGQKLRSIGGVVNHIGYSLAFTPDGKALAASDDSMELTLWDVKTGQAIRKFEYVYPLVRGLAISPDGTILASKYSDQTIKLWNIADGQEMITLVYPDRSDWQPYEYSLNSPVFSPDGTELAACSYWDAAIWDVKNGKKILAFKGVSGFNTIVAFSPDGKLFVLGSAGEIKIWDLNSGQLIHDLTSSMGIINALDFTPDGKILASGSSDSTIRLWDVSTGKGIALLKGHTSGVQSLEFSPDGSLLASGSSDGTIRLWGLAP